LLKKYSKIPDYKNAKSKSYLNHPQVEDFHLLLPLGEGWDGVPINFENLDGHF